MASLEAFTPAQIKACRMMIDYVGVEKLRVLALKLGDHTGSNFTRRFRLYVPVSDKELSDEEFMISFGIDGLKVLSQVLLEISKRNISIAILKKTRKHLRALSFSSTRWGRLREGE